MLPKAAPVSICEAIAGLKQAWKSPVMGTNWTEQAGYVLHFFAPGGNNPFSRRYMAAMP